MRLSGQPLWEFCTLGDSYWVDAVNFRFSCKSCPGICVTAPSMPIRRVRHQKGRDTRRDGGSEDTHARAMVNFSTQQVALAFSGEICRACEQRRRLLSALSMSVNVVDLSRKLGTLRFVNRQFACGTSLRSISCYHSNLVDALQPIIESYFVQVLLPGLDLT